MTHYEAHRSLEMVINNVPPMTRAVTKDHVAQVITESGGTLTPGWCGALGCLQLKGTVATVHQGHTYHTPLLIKLAEYPHRAPLVSVMPTETMQPHTRARGYQLTRDGTIGIGYMASWQPGHSTLAGLIRDLKALFNHEPPLYAIPRSQQQAPRTSAASSASLQKVRRFLDDDQRLAGYNEKQRVVDDVAETIEKYRSLIMKPEARGASLVMILSGTVPTRFRENIYNIPVSIVIPKDYPNPRYGRPEPFVVPTEGMEIKPRHRNVDGRGVVFCDYLSQWQASTHYLLRLVEQMIVIFENEPPVFSRPAQQRPVHQAPVRPPPNQPPPQKPKPGVPTPELLKKLAEEPRVTPAEDAEKACDVCYENVKDCLLLPCKHMCLCMSCVKDVMKADKSCPMCRTKIEDVIQAYV